MKSFAVEGLRALRFRVLGFVWLCLSGSGIGLGFTWVLQTTLFAVVLRWLTFDGRMTSSLGFGVAYLSW